MIKESDHEQHDWTSSRALLAWMDSMEIGTTFRRLVDKKRRSMFYSKTTYRVDKLDFNRIPPAESFPAKSIEYWTRRDQSRLTSQAIYQYERNQATFSRASLAINRLFPTPQRLQ